ncbi:Aste57867_9617 [Aphanomyces stellatus]|uniref:Aste57867_9617 protein n=1 Tax=Aphanomyces stellatus TaxID=120398 RepID=A0A485KNV3_9STRA|nr:hypothetical protein As57867_009579 [Aphanomyces stellatus]VFT86496.1 Aste57867_9617 [Aphanomyces stellatus]
MAAEPKDNSVALSLLFGLLKDESDGSSSSGSESEAPPKTAAPSRSAPLQPKSKPAKKVESSDDDSDDAGSEDDGSSSAHDRDDDYDTLPEKKLLRRKSSESDARKQPPAKSERRRPSKKTTDTTHSETHVDDDKERKTELQNLRKRQKRQQARDEREKEVRDRIAKTGTATAKDEAFLKVCERERKKTRESHAVDKKAAHAAAAQEAAEKKEQAAAADIEELRLQKRRARDAALRQRKLEAKRKHTTDDDQDTSMRTKETARDDVDRKREKRRRDDDGHRDHRHAEERERRVAGDPPQKKRLHIDDESDEVRRPRPLEGGAKRARHDASEGLPPPTRPTAKVEPDITKWRRTDKKMEAKPVTPEEIKAIPRTSPTTDALPHEDEQIEETHEPGKAVETAMLPFVNFMACPPASPISRDPTPAAKLSAEDGEVDEEATKQESVPEPEMDFTIPKKEVTKKPVDDDPPIPKKLERPPSEPLPDKGRRNSGYGDGRPPRATMKSSPPPTPYPTYTPPPRVQPKAAPSPVYDHEMKKFLKTAAQFKSVARSISKHPSSYAAYRSNGTKFVEPKPLGRESGLRGFDEQLPTFYGIGLKCTAAPREIKEPHVQRLAEEADALGKLLELTPLARSELQRFLYGVAFMPLSARRRCTVIFRSMRYEHKSMGVIFNARDNCLSYAKSLANRFAVDGRKPCVDIPTDAWKDMQRGGVASVFVHYYSMEDAEDAATKFYDDHGVRGAILQDMYFVPPSMLSQAASPPRASPSPPAVAAATRRRDDETSRGNPSPPKASPPVVERRRSRDRDHPNGRRWHRSSERHERSVRPPDDVVLPVVPPIGDLQEDGSDQTTTPQRRAENPSSRRRSVERDTSADEPGRIKSMEQRGLTKDGGDGLPHRPHDDDTREEKPSPERLSGTEQADRCQNTSTERHDVGESAADADRAHAHTIDPSDSRSTSAQDEAPVASGNHEAGIEPTTPRGEGSRQSKERASYDNAQDVKRQATTDDERRVMAERHRSAERSVEASRRVDGPEDSRRRSKERVTNDHIQDAQPRATTDAERRDRHRLAERPGSTDTRRSAERSNRDQDDRRPRRDSRRSAGRETSSHDDDAKDSSRRSKVRGSNDSIQDAQPWATTDAERRDRHRSAERSVEASSLDTRRSAERSNRDQDDRRPRRDSRRSAGRETGSHDDDGAGSRHLSDRRRSNDGPSRGRSSERLPRSDPASHNAPRREKTPPRRSVERHREGVGARRSPSPPRRWSLDRYGGSAAGVRRSPPRDTPPRRRQDDAADGTRRPHDTTTSHRVPLRLYVSTTRRPDRDLTESDVRGLFRGQVEHFAWGPPAIGDKPRHAFVTFRTAADAADALRDDGKVVLTDHVGTNKLRVEVPRRQTTSDRSHHHHRPHHHPSRS